MAFVVSTLVFVFTAVSHLQMWISRPGLQSSVRDTLGTSLYFFEYDGLRHIMGRLPSGEQSTTPTWMPVPVSVVPFMCGSLAGVSSWAIIYPLDVYDGFNYVYPGGPNQRCYRVKTKVQQRALAGVPYKGPLETLHRLIRGTRSSF